jgi:hypothetical protein
MSTIGELSKRLLSRRPKVEPIFNQRFLQHGTNILVETSETNGTSVHQSDVTGVRNKKCRFGKIIGGFMGFLILGYVVRRTLTLLKKN